MKLTRLESSENPDLELWVESTPKQSDKTITVFGYDTFDMLNETWEDQHDRLLISIDEGEGAISLFLAKSKIGNGFVKRNLESGTYVVGQIFDIVSPIYFIKEPIYDLSESPTLKFITTSDITTDKKNCMFFPKAPSSIRNFINGQVLSTDIKVYGKIFGIAGTSQFYETMSFDMELELGGFSSFALNNRTVETGIPDVYHKYIAGEYLIL